MKKLLLLSALLIGGLTAMARAESYYVDIAVSYSQPKQAYLWQLQTYEFNGEIPVHDLFTGACYSEADVNYVFLNVVDMKGNLVASHNGFCQGVS